MIPSLFARFDTRVLSAEHTFTKVCPEVGKPSSPEDRTRWDRLVLWCTTGVDGGHRPWWAPGRKPRFNHLFSVAVWTPSADPNTPDLLRRFANQLDGSLALAAMPRARQRWAFRLQVKWWDAQWWRQRRYTDPWDCGYLRPEASTTDLVAFRPRRATLVVVQGLPPEELLERVQALSDQSPAYRQPLRLLLTDTHAHATLKQAGVEHQLLG